jgi:hypothetical protein
VLFHRLLVPSESYVLAWLLTGTRRVPPGNSTDMGPRGRGERVNALAVDQPNVNAKADIAKCSGARPCGSLTWPARGVAFLFR